MKDGLFSLMMSMALSAFLLTACSKDQPTGPDQNLGSDEQLSLDKEFGGFTNSDELPGFGDPNFLNEFGEDADVADPMSSLSKTAAELASSAVKSYLVRLSWGRLEGDSTATEVVDWSGSAEVNKGTLAVLKAVRFENNDYIHLPRESRQKLEFTSQTQKSFDGILIAIIDNDTSLANVEGTLTFTAGSYSRVFSFSELDSTDLVEPVGSGGDAVSIISRAKEVTPFAGGFLAGRWIRENRQGGIFKGRWINSLGTNGGHVRGIWGINRNGEPVFFGKYISLSGEFGGLLRGLWEFTRGENGGVFKGRWFDRNHNESGTLGGHFKTGQPGDGRGYFQGRWRQGR
jgi:hypothetical protein